MNASLDFARFRYTAPAVIAAVAIGAAALVISTTAEADDDLRGAGDEDRFRVIDRFDDSDVVTDGAYELPAVDEDSRLHAAVEQVEHEEWNNADSKFRNLSGATDFLAERPAKRFLAGYVALQAGDADRALNLFDGLCDDTQPIDDYCAHYTAKAAMENGDPHRATIAAARISEDSRLYADSLLLLAESLTEAGESEDLRRAAEVLELYLRNYSDRNDAADARLKLGETYEELDRLDDAAEAYIELRDNHPLRDEAGDAEDRLDRLADDLDDRFAERIDEESLDRTMRRFRGLHNLHRSETIIDELPDKIDDFPDDAESERCEALYMVADCHTKLRKHAEAVPWYDRVLDECADVEDYEVRALYRTARSRWNAGNYDGALTHWARIFDEYPDHSFADDAKFFTARILRSDDRPDEAYEVLHRQVERYPDGDMAKDAHWLIVRHYFEQDDFSAAVDYIDELDDTGEDDLYTRGRLHYFRALAHKRLGDADAAEKGFAQVAEDYPMSYYALLAFNRLARLSGIDADDACDAVSHYCESILNDGDHADAEVEIPRQLRDDDAFARGSLLLALGLNSHARSEFSDLRRRHSADDSTLWALSSLLDDAGAYPISHDIARRHIDGWMDDYPAPSTRHLWEIGYPSPFQDEVARYAERRDGVDAPKIWAIMREESGFNPRIESWANARGLLQLLDDTARRMANRVGMNPYSFDKLDEPDTNVRLGTAYMEQLGERLQPHPALVSAGYNGGAGNVTNWLDSFGDEQLDLFVEDIPFHQTRNYTKRVLMSYWIYSYLHGDNRVPIVDFDLSD